MRIRFWRRLAKDKDAREAWEAGLSWFRLRYLDSRSLRRALLLLSSAQACGRVALYYLPDDVVSRLYIGVPAAYVAVLQRMSADFHFMVQPIVDRQLPPITPLTAAERLPWERSFHAHIVDDHLFLACDAGVRAAGPYLPSTPYSTVTPGEWHLPQPAPVGLSLQASSWNGQGVPAELRRTEIRTGWPLGYSCDGALLVAGPHVNVYSSGNCTAAWLVQLVEYLLREEGNGLIVLDGKGDLVPTLKRKPTVTRLLGSRLLYVDIDETTASGFNPLAATSGEQEGETLQRWQQWFGGMGVHREGLHPLAHAMADGVTDVATLSGWLQRPAQQPFAAGVTALQTTLRRMQRDPVVREWLSWPTNVFAGLAQDNLLLSCHDVGWPRQQLLRGALLAALSLREARLLIHGFPRAADGFGDLLPEATGQILLSNGPRLQKSTVVLTRSGAPAAANLAAHFLGGDALYEEQMQLLGAGKAMMVHGEEAVYALWRQKWMGDD